MLRYHKVIEDMISGLERSVSIHGFWEQYTPEQAFAIVRDEFFELRAAYDMGKVHGDHGMIREYRDVAVCCIKAMLLLQNTHPAPPEVVEADQ